MLRPLHRLSICGAIAAALLGTAVAMPASADDTAVPIGPDQYFSGQINGSTSNPVIRVRCTGSAQGIGHPVGGQSIGVTPADATTAGPGTGYTGDAADHAVIGFDGLSVGAMLSLKSYDTKAEIPAELNLPCSGTGTVAIVPAPADATTQAAMLTVTYLPVLD
jgi:hypothetical protein